MTKMNRNILPKDAAGAAVTEPHAKGKIDQEVHWSLVFSLS